MRGEHQGKGHTAKDDFGIIPACAGSTRKVNLVNGRREGSSPHARGARA